VLTFLFTSAGDIRAHLTRFKEENLKQNFAIVDALKAVAERRGITPAQLCIAWVSALGPTVIPLVGSSYVAAIALSICHTDHV
jgi:pyridoxine 4-dehydrogenase